MWKYPGVNHSKFTPRACWHFQLCLYWRERFEAAILCDDGKKKLILL